MIENVENILARPLKQNRDKLKQAVLARFSVCESVWNSVNKASVIYQRIICTKIPCISVLYFAIKPDDFSAEMLSGSVQSEAWREELL